MSDQQIIDVILNGAGRNEMPAIPVTEEEAQRIVDYMRESF
jgi:mono/diheme cytochrome c family protein